MIGPIINPLGVIVGSVFGAAFGSRIPQRIKENLPLVFGIAAMGLGVPMIAGVEQFPAVILALLIGTVIGELLKLEDRVRILAGKLREVSARFGGSVRSGADPEEYQERFVAMIVLFCLSGAAILGSLQEGLTGDPSILIIKAILDFFTAMIFATTLGYSLAFAALPQFIVQAGLFIVASLLLPLMTETMLADFSALGGLIMLATGFRICRIVDIPLTNMVPAMLIVFPISALWSGIAF